MQSRANLRSANQGSELLSIVDQKIKNENYTRVVGDHLKKVKSHLHTRFQRNDVYFKYLKWVYNKKCGEEKVLNQLPRAKLLDQFLRETFGRIPNNCVHLRASFFTWRDQKCLWGAVTVRNDDDPTEIARSIKKQYILCRRDQTSRTTPAKRSPASRPSPRKRPPTTKATFSRPIRTSRRPPESRFLSVRAPFPSPSRLRIRRPRSADAAL